MGKDAMGPWDRLRRLLGLRAGPRLLARLNRAEVDAAEDREWAIVRPVYDLLARTEYRDLTPRQRVAQLVLFYGNEIDNGGHLQYFHNQGRRRARALMRALTAVGADAQRAAFVDALVKAVRDPVGPAESLEAYSERAYEQEFRAEDDAFYTCRPELGRELLPRYILAHLADFAVWE
jgi:hypothetical protein